eukprot:m.16911 g.16911  ORF g.16911 m.16911 type:complete len:498 (+) comp5836_c0_seq2:186-1679(+)
MDDEDEYGHEGYSDEYTTTDGEAEEEMKEEESQEEPEEILEPHEWKARGNDFYKQGQYRKAIELYSKAIEGAPEEAAYYNNRAAALMMLQDFKAGLEDAKVAAKLSPATTKYLERMARCFSALGMASDAQRTYMKVLEIDPNSAAAKKEVGDLGQVDQFRKQAIMAIANGHFNSAISLLDRALQLTPADDSLKLLQAEVYLKQKKFGEAERISAGVLRREINNTEALYVRGLCMYGMGELEKAQDHFTRALRGDPDHSKSRTQLKLTKALAGKKKQGNEFFKSGKYEEALTAYDEALAIDSNNTEIASKLYYNKAIALSKLRRNEEALRDCNKALELDPSYVKALVKRARLKIELENYEEAVRDCEAACNTMKDDPELESMLREAQLELKKSKRKNYYKILDVAKDAGDYDIKRAYKKMAMKTHPDRCKDESKKEEAEAKFKDVNEAYSVLSDSEKRHRYDQGADIEEINSGHSHHGGGRMNPEDIFAQFFRHGGGF